MKVIMMTVTCAFILGIMGNNPSWAGSAGGTVQNLIIHGNNDVIVFNLSGEYTDAPACATASRFAADTTTRAGRNILANVTAAYFSGKSLTVLGANTCTAWSDSEDIYYIHFSE